MQLLNQQSINLQNKISNSAFSVKETTIAYDLTDLYAKTVAKAEFEVDETRLDQIKQVSYLSLLNISFYHFQIFTQLSAITEPDSESKKASNTLVPLANTLISWSTENPSASSIERQFGDAQLNQVFAKAFEVINSLRFQSLI